MVADWEPLLSSLTKLPVRVSNILIKVPFSLAVANRVPWMLRVMQLKLKNNKWKIHELWKVIIYNSGDFGCDEQEQGQKDMAETLSEDLKSAICNKLEKYS